MIVGTWLAMSLWFQTTGVCQAGFNRLRINTDYYMDVIRHNHVIQNLYVVVMLRYIFYVIAYNFA